MYVFNFTKKLYESATYNHILRSYYFNFDHKRIDFCTNFYNFKVYLVFMVIKAYLMRL